MFTEKLRKASDAIYKEAKEYLTSQIMLHDGKMQYEFVIERDEGIYYFYSALIIDEDMDIVATGEDGGNIDHCLYEEEICEIASDIYQRQEEKERE